MLKNQVKSSSTVVILRDRMSANHEECYRRTLEVLLLKRSPQSRFLPNALVFPGGGIEPNDDEIALKLLDEACLNDCLIYFEQWGFKSRQVAMASLGAAIRETEEECGLKLPHLLTQERAIRCLSHWLTPAALKRRFDAYFWGMAIPSDIELPLSVDGIEICEAKWWTPQDALKAYNLGRIDLPVPTLMTLIELDEVLSQRSEHFQTVRVKESSLSDQIIEYLSQSPHQYPIQPILDRGKELRLLFPRDNDYASKAIAGEINEAPRRSFWSATEHHLIKEKILMSDESGTEDDRLSRWRRVYKPMLR